MQNQISVHISYKNDVEAVANRLVDKLEAAGYNAWWDKKLLPGTEWDQQIFDSIRSCDVLIVLISAQVESSDWVRREIDVARGASVSVLPIVVGKRDGFDVYGILEKLILSKFHSTELFREDDSEFSKIKASIEKLAQTTRVKKGKSLGEKGIINVSPVFGLPSMNKQFKCDIFMIMPFADTFPPIYKMQIEPLVKALNLDIKRGDAFFSKHMIMNEIWAAIFNSKLVIADCSGKNANVFYELGIAHAIGKPVLMITQNIDDIPFDLRHLRFIVYDHTTDRGLEILVQQLENAIQRILADIEEETEK